MKYSFLILLMLTTVMSISEDEIKSIGKGLIKALEIKEDQEVLLKCVNGSLEQYWSKSYNYLKKINDWTVNISFTLGFTNFMQSTTKSLGMMALCSFKAIEPISDKLDTLAEDLSKAYEKILSNKHIFILTFTDIVSNWDLNQFEQVGISSGKALKYLIEK